MTNDGQQIIFQNGAWQQGRPDLAIFDDAFVADNVCSGIDLETSHRRNLHELILGAQGVALNHALQSHVARIEQHNTELHERGKAIPATARGPFSVTAFCDLEADPDIEAKIQEAERRLAAAKSADAVRQRSGFEEITLPEFDIDAINGVLGESLANLELDAAARVKAHLASLGDGGETWVADGMTRIAPASRGQDSDICPFCAQSLHASMLIDHYRAYFSDAYEALTKSIRDTDIAVQDEHGGDVTAAFERDVRKAVQNHEFWKEFTELPEIAIDTAAISREWAAAREAVLQCLRAKAASPLEAMEVDQNTLQAVQAYRSRIREVADLSASLVACNRQLSVIKEQAGADDLSSLTDDLNKLKARKARFDPEIASLCDAYLHEKTAKSETQAQRDEARAALDQYREQIFPAYETAINDFLRRFNATFRIARVQSVNTRSDSSASYCVVINHQEVNITAEHGPNFRNTLSAGDRNALALAFFFASLDQDPSLAQKIVVIDDPITSLDEHRTLATRQEIRSLHERVNQVIVLSHSKSFLCALWEEADNNIRSALRIGRAHVGSELVRWDVRDDCITAHDKRHELVARYLQAADPNEERKVAEALRPILEAFVRVAYPRHFPPGSLLGPFIETCRQRQGTGNQILSEGDTIELKALLDYANRFHHDTNRAWETEAINDAELTDFARRTLLFTSRS